jgi:hypothetical protein
VLRLGVAACDAVLVLAWLVVGVRLVVVECDVDGVELCVGVDVECVGVVLCDGVELFAGVELFDDVELFAGALFGADAGAFLCWASIKVGTTIISSNTAVLRVICSNFVRRFITASWPFGTIHSNPGANLPTHEKLPACSNPKTGKSFSDELPNFRSVA